MWIDGGWSVGIDLRHLTNPATGRSHATVAEGGSDAVDRAVSAARAALAGSWRDTTPSERSAVLLRLADLVA